MIINVICMMIGYFCGCISCGFFVGKYYHLDIRTMGSGNAGSTNVLRNLGIRPALWCFIGDLAKVVIPLLLIRVIWNPQDWYLICLYFGIGAVLGHNYPFYLHFKGGKGIAVTAGVVMAACHPLMTPIGLGIFILVVGVTRYVSLGSLFVAWYIPVNTVLFYRKDAQFIHLLILSLIFTFFAYFRHRQNIVRLLHGNENKISLKKKEK